ncbi:MAG TPA: sulfite exporter TauE/SafE family protein [Vicinamibacteria bacterium]|nr:sulfite exporter TauE/SafE family protein [Vicinamibacteria bacterium]
MHHHVLPASGDLPLLFLASLFGSAHCVGMCGPYVALCTSRLTPAGAPRGGSLLLRLLFNLGRIATYAAIGLLAGAFGQIALAAAERAGLKGAVSLSAGLLAIVLSLALLGLVRDPLGVLLKGGLDAFVKGGVGHASQRPSYAAALSLGALQGLLPCALVYAAASRAAASGSAGGGGLTMVVFGLGTLPAVFALASLSPALLGRFRPWRFSGLFVGAVGVLLVLRGLSGFHVIPESPLW